MLRVPSSIFLVSGLGLKVWGSGVEDYGFVPLATSTQESEVLRSESPADGGARERRETTGCEPFEQTVAFSLIGGRATPSAS